MKIGKVERYITEKIEEDGGLLFILVDPIDHDSPEAAAKEARISAEAGCDLVLVGGSIGAQGRLLDSTTNLIKESVDVPINIFPGNIATLTPYADSIYFMSMLNSRNPYWISTAQTLAAMTVREMGLEPLPTGYIVVEPGGTVGWVGDANMVPRKRPQVAAALALGGQYAGCRFILTDAGSASEPGPVPYEMVKAVSGTIDVPYIVAGGVRKLNEAEKIIKYGGDAIQIGTAMERASDTRKTVGNFVKVIKRAGKSKKKKR
jgi:phosphoglycerol geranylgeranyltransferase